MISDMLQKEFQDRIGFHDRCRKNETTLVYDTAGGSYIEAAIYSLGVRDEQLISNVARRIKDTLVGIPSMMWPPSVDELERPQGPNDIFFEVSRLVEKPIHAKLWRKYGRSNCLCIGIIVHVIHNRQTFLVSNTAVGDVTWTDQKP